MHNTSKTHLLAYNTLSRTPRHALTPQGYSGGPSGGPSSSDNPPCNTLFVGNLCETVNEAELNSIFAVQPVGVFSQFQW